MVCLGASSCCNMNFCPSLKFSTFSPRTGMNFTPSSHQLWSASLSQLKKSFPHSMMLLPLSYWAFQHSDQKVTIWSSLTRGLCPTCFMYHLHCLRETLNRTALDKKIKRLSSMGGWGGHKLFIQPEKQKCDLWKWLVATSHQTSAVQQQQQQQQLCGNNDSKLGPYCTSSQLLMRGWKWWLFYFDVEQIHCYN